MKISEIMTSDPGHSFCAAEDGSVIRAPRSSWPAAGSAWCRSSRAWRRARRSAASTDRDIVVRVVAEGRDPNVVASLSEVMTHDLCTCSPSDDVDDVRKMMEQRQIRRVLVTDEHGSLVGIVAIADLATSLDNKTKVGETLEQISEP